LDDCFNQDANQLYFYNDNKQFYFYNYKGGESYLKWLFKLAPRIPFIRTEKLSFTDYLPVYIVKSKLQTLLIEFLSSLNRNFYKQEFIYKFDGNSIYSIFGEIHLEAASKALASIKYNKTQLRRKK